MSQGQKPGALRDTTHSEYESAQKLFELWCLGILKEGLLCKLTVKSLAMMIEFSLQPLSFAWGWY